MLMDTTFLLAYTYPNCIIQITEGSGDVFLSESIQLTYMKSSF